jgi:hypothetical protein
MEIESVSMGRLLLCGMAFYGNPFSMASAWSEENEIGRLWKRFQAYSSSGAPLPPSALRGPWYEVHIGSSEAAAIGDYEVFVGISIEDPWPAPIACCLKVLPGNDYAKLALAGDEILSDWGLGLEEEVEKRLGRRILRNYSFQLYDERFKGMDRLGESVLDVYLPLE